MHGQRQALRIAGGQHAQRLQPRFDALGRLGIHGRCSGEQAGAELADGIGGLSMAVGGGVQQGQFLAAAAGLACQLGGTLELRGGFGPAFARLPVQGDLSRRATPHLQRSRDQRVQQARDGVRQRRQHGLGGQVEGDALARQQLGGLQLVHRLGQVHRVRGQHRSGGVQREAAAHQRGDAQQPQRRCRQAGQPRLHTHSQRRRRRLALGQARGGQVATAGAQQLQHEQGPSAGAAQQLGGQPAARRGTIVARQVQRVDKSLHRAGIQRRQVQARQSRTVLVRGVQARGERLGHGFAATPGHQQRGACAVQRLGRAQQAGKRRSIGPLQVVDDDVARAALGRQQRGPGLLQAQWLDVAGGRLTQVGPPTRQLRAGPAGHRHARAPGFAQRARQQRMRRTNLAGMALQPQRTGADGTHHLLGQA